MSQNIRQHFLNLTVSPAKPHYSNQWYNAVSECIESSYSTYIIAEEKGKDSVPTHVHVALRVEAETHDIAKNTLNQRVYRKVKDLPGYNKNHTIKIVKHEDAYPFGYNFKEEGRKFTSPGVTDDLLAEGQRVFTLKGEGFKLDKSERLARGRMEELADRLFRFKNVPNDDDYVSTEGMSNNRLFERMCAEGWEGTTFSDYTFFKRYSGLIKAYMDDIIHQKLMERMEQRRAQKATRAPVQNPIFPIDATLGNSGGKKRKAEEYPKLNCRDCGCETRGTEIDRLRCSTCSFRRHVVK